MRTRDTRSGKALGCKNLASLWQQSGGLGIAKMIRQHYSRLAANGEAQYPAAGVENATQGQSGLLQANPEESPK